MLLNVGQRLLNEQIRSSTAARERMHDLDGRSFAVKVRDSDIRIVASVADGSLELDFGGDAAVDVELTAGLVDLLRLARSAEIAALKDFGATLNGDIHVAESFAELLKLATPDPEDMLADWIGDIPAHAIGEVARSAAAFGHRTQAAMTANLAEYLQEEQPTLVPPALARGFAAEIERIRDDVERAERRVQMLERARNAKAARP